MSMLELDRKCQSRMKKSLLIILIPLITALSTFLLYGCIDDLIQSVEEVQELKLSSYPSAFKEDTLIVIGKEASEIEKESASFIEENLKESIQTELTIKNDEEILESDKNSNLILIDIPFSNGLLQELYAMTDTGIEKVTSEYPGKNKGILQILENPWNSEKALLVVAGSDEWGIMATLEILDRLEGLDESIVISEFRTPAESAFFDKYIFIEHNIHTHIEIIEGIYPGPVVDSPTYSFDETSGTLRNYLSFDINDSLVLVYGRGSSISGAGGGMENMLHGVYQLPYESGNVTILSIDVNGAVYLEYRNNLIILEKGQKWEDTVSKTDVTSSGTAELTTGDSIKNYGFLEKSKINMN